MSDEQKVLVRLKPNKTEEYYKFLKEFELEESMVNGTKSLIKDNVTTTHEGYLVVVFPERIDCVLGFEPDEYVILAD